MTNNSDIKEAKRWTYAWLALTVLCLWVGDTQEPVKNLAAFTGFGAGFCAALSVKG